MIWGLLLIIQIQSALIPSANVTHCFDSQSRSVSNIQAFENLKLLPKHYFKLTMAGSGDPLTTKRVSRQMCVCASNVSVFYVYESRCNLSDKGALIDTFGRLSPAGREGHRASNQAPARLHTNESLSSNGLHNIQQHKTQQISSQPALNCARVQSPCVRLQSCGLPGPGSRTGFRTVCAVSQCGAGRGSSPGTAVQICFSVWRTFELITQQKVIWMDWVNMMW